MNKNSLTTAVIAGIAGVAGIANMASAVNLNPDGLGQTLLYPYYTVNGGQQTLISVVNTTGNAKAVKVRFLEGYNSREVLDFNLFLSKYDVWTAGVFALSDAGITADGAGILSTDNSCIGGTPTGYLDESTTPGGAPYVAFRNFAYTTQGATDTSPTDTGPTGDDRTREGHFEIISMADIAPTSVLAGDITHINSVPPYCSSAEADFEAAFGTTDLAPPTSGIFGAASVVNVGNGTYFAYNADALEGFTSITLGTPSGSLTPSLNNVNDAGAPASVTAYVFNNGAVVTAPYATPAQGIDAVSAIFDASNLYNEWEYNGNGSVGTDWVVTFPTKRFYVDTLTAYAGTLAPIAPFEQAFGGVSPGLSCDTIGVTIFDREENSKAITTIPCSISPCQPDPAQPSNALCHETNVISFGDDSILHSGLSYSLDSTSIIGNAGWMQVSLTDAAHGGGAQGGTVQAKPHAMRADNNGTVFYGLPATGFEAVNFVNGNLGGVLANYSGVYRHRFSRCADTTATAGACS